MIYTSSYLACRSSFYLTYSISGDHGIRFGYHGVCFPLLAPKKAFWETWHNNIGKISEEENNRYYIERYYKEVLSCLDPEEIYNELDNSIILCYENNDEFCHRHIVAAWFELLLGVEVSEISISFNKIEKLERPSYIKETLKEIMIKDLDMSGFESLSELYKHNKKIFRRVKNNGNEQKTN